MTDLNAIPAEAVEAAARALYDLHRHYDAPPSRRTPSWDATHEMEHTMWRARAAEALAAALPYLAQPARGEMKGDDRG